MIKNTEKTSSFSPQSLQDITVFLACGLHVPAATKSEKKEWCDHSKEPRSRLPQVSLRFPEMMEQKKNA
jgi:hypothetical protein